ncbi:Ribulose bisphosphate carboxylase small chain, chloroplastic [Morella rubra]|uniref:Ribulose bisphosphate carboxylase small subunit n=1 Tax=Morella rubra TaxID=262757 RepID=A0A6A1VEA3_9ROSI|nr:Ribulose bisphosphate carboxylase small chain, chloroplastic [Morella rubra]KAB1211192.1 Ribulose bisphosphate carboxylase small chain, chloroplastic [Morella rubra]
MASSMISLATVATVNRASFAQASMVAPFTSLKSAATFPVNQKTNNNIASISRNDGRVQCMQKFKTLSYLPPLNMESLGQGCRLPSKKGMDSLLGIRVGGHSRSPLVLLMFVSKFSGTTLSTVRTIGHQGTTMAATEPLWKLPMFGCTDSLQVLRELEECMKAYPIAFIRIIKFDNKRQLQCISFIVYKPPSF